MKSLFAAFIMGTAAIAAQTPPNVVFILADDLGITDIGAYATHFNKVKAEELFYETPHLDRLVQAHPPAPPSSPAASPRESA